MVPYDTFGHRIVLLPALIEPGPSLADRAILVLHCARKVIVRVWN